MIVKKIITVFAVVLTAAASMQAMVIPGRWEKVAAEETGSRIIVTLMAGDRIECLFNSLSTDSLVVSSPGGMERKIRKDDVLRITTADKRADSLANGAALGALVAGAPVGLIALLCSAADTCTGEQAALTFAIWTGIGAGIGLAVDAGVKDYETLYEARMSKSGP